MLKKEFKALGKRKFYIVAMIALALIPAIYNFIFLGSLWDPYGHLQELPVAVTNLDKQSNLNGETLDLGNQVVKKMKETKDLDYQFVSKTAASKGLADGKYYMAITFPQDFSTNAASLMTKSPKKVQINYQTSRGHNYISSKMGETAMEKLKEEVSGNITEQYSQAIFSDLTKLKSGMTQAADGSAELATGASTLDGGIKTLSSSMLDFTNGTDSLKVGLEQYLAGVETAKVGAEQAAAGTNQLVAGTEQLAAGTQTLQDKSSALTNGLTQLQAGSESLNQLLAGSQSLSTGLSQLESSTQLTSEETRQISQLIAGLSSLNSQLQNTGNMTAPVIADVTTQLTNVQSVLTALPTAQEMAINRLADLTETQKAEVISALQNSSARGLQSVTDSLTQVQSDLTGLQTSLSSDALSQANTVLLGAGQYLGQLSTGLASINSALSNQLLPGSNQLTAGLSQFSNVYSVASNQLVAGFNQYSQGVAQANQGAQSLSVNSRLLNSGNQTLAAGLSQLASHSESLQSGVTQLQTGSAQLSSGVSQLSTGSAQLATGSASLASRLQSANDSLSQTKTTQANAKAIANPLTTKQRDTDNVVYNGEGMAPYMVSVALFIGALSTQVVIGTSFSKKKWRRGRDFMFSKLVINGAVALAQAIIVFLALEALGLSANHWFLTLAGIILISFTYMSMVTFFVTWLGKVGDFAMIVLLVLQLATSAGTYPIELAPKIYQWISPFLPMTYALKMLRSTIGLNGAEWPVAFTFMGITLLFVFGLSLFKNGYESPFE